MKAHPALTEEHGGTEIMKYLAARQLGWEA